MSHSAHSARRRRRLISTAAVGGVVAAVAFAGTPAAVAANSYLQFSVDGQAYSSSVRGPIFDQGIRFTPGASTSATVWVRNSSDELASLSSAAVMVQSAPELNPHIGLQAGLYPSLSARSALGLQGTCTNTGQTWDLEAGEELELRFVVDLALEAPNQTQNKSADFDLLFLLESKSAGTVPRLACDALKTPDQIPSAPGTGQGEPAGPDSGSNGLPVSRSAAAGTAELVTIPGTGASVSPVRNGIRTAGLEARTPVESIQGEVSRPEAVAPAGIVPAGFQSTVEPIIRSLSGTLLIVMSVVFCAAVILRLRNRQA